MNALAPTEGWPRVRATTPDPVFPRVDPASSCLPVARSSHTPPVRTGAGRVVPFWCLWPALDLDHAGASCGIPGRAARPARAQYVTARPGSLNPVNDIGPFSWMNWRAERSGNASPTEAYEALLFTDAMLTGFRVQGDLGPYSIVNALGRLSQEMRPGLALRVNLYSVDMQPNKPYPLGPATGSDAWIGLSIDQEIACLLVSIR